MTVVRGILENLKMISHMVKGHKIGMMAQTIPVNLLMVAEKVLEERNSLMVIHMKVNT